MVIVYQCMYCHRYWAKIHSFVLHKVTHWEFQRDNPELMAEWREEVRLNKERIQRERENRPNPSASASTNGDNNSNNDPIRPSPPVQPEPLNRASEEDAEETEDHQEADESGSDRNESTDTDLPSGQDSPTTDEDNHPEADPDNEDVEADPDNEDVEADPDNEDVFEAETNLNQNQGAAEDVHPESESEQSEPESENEEYQSAEEDPVDPNSQLQNNSDISITEEIPPPQGIGNEPEPDPEPQPSTSHSRRDRSPSVEFIREKIKARRRGRVTGRLVPVPYDPNTPFVPIPVKREKLWVGLEDSANETPTYTDGDPTQGKIAKIQDARITETGGESDGAAQDEGNQTLDETNLTFTNFHENTETLELSKHKKSAIIKRESQSPRKRKRGSPDLRNSENGMKPEFLSPLKSQSLRHKQTNDTNDNQDESSPDQACTFRDQSYEETMKTEEKLEISKDQHVLPPKRITRLSIRRATLNLSPDTDDVVFIKAEKGLNRGKFPQYCSFCHCNLDPDSITSSPRSGSIEDPPACADCKDAFGDLKILRKSAFRTRLFSCSACKRTFQRKPSLISHFRVHTKMPDWRASQIECFDIGSEVGPESQAQAQEST